MTAAAVKAKLSAHEVTTSSLAWRDGMPDWTALGTIAELNADEEPPPLPTTATSTPHPPASASTTIDPGTRKYGGYALLGGGAVVAVGAIVVDVLLPSSADGF